MLEFLKKEANKTYTENGAVTVLQHIRAQNLSASIFSRPSVRCAVKVSRRSPRVFSVPMRRILIWR